MGDKVKIFDLDVPAVGCVAKNLLRSLGCKASGLVPRKCWHRGLRDEWIGLHPRPWDFRTLPWRRSTKLREGVCVPGRSSSLVRGRQRRWSWLGRVACNGCQCSKSYYGLRGWKQIIDLREGDLHFRSLWLRIRGYVRCGAVYNRGPSHSIAQTHSAEIFRHSCRRASHHMGKSSWGESLWMLKVSNILTKVLDVTRRARYRGEEIVVVCILVELYREFTMK